MSATADFFRARLDEMVDQKHLLVVLSKRLPWSAIEQTLAPHFARKSRPGLKIATQDLLGEHDFEFGAGVSPAGRARLAMRLIDGQPAVPEERFQPQR
jgi:transposase, IS5 family